MNIGDILDSCVYVAYIPFIKAVVLLKVYLEKAGLLNTVGSARYHELYGLPSLYHAGEDTDIDYYTPVWIVVGIEYKGP